VSETDGSESPESFKIADVEVTFDTRTLKGSNPKSIVLNVLVAPRTENDSSPYNHLPTGTGVEKLKLPVLKETTKGLKYIEPPFEFLMLIVPLSDDKNCACFAR
jgi:hypothetical protein